MPRRPWNAAATAPPVSPDVATRIVTGRAESSPTSGSARSIRAARKRAPTSLNAAVGPWNSSSTASLPSTSGFSGTGKFNASRQIAGSSRSSGEPAKNGARTSAAISASVSPRTSSGVKRGSASGTYRPPSGASPCITASTRSVSAPLLVLRKRIDCSILIAAQHATQPQQVGEDARSRHVGSGARPANDQRIVAVALRHELHNVVRQADVRERMILGEALQPDARGALPHVDLGDVTQHRSRLRGRLDARGHRRIEIGEPIEKLVDRCIRERGRHEALDLDLI